LFGDDFVNSIDIGGDEPDPDAVVGSTDHKAAAENGEVDGDEPLDDGVAGARKRKGRLADLVSSKQFFKVFFASFT
jgi:hypothetical protein